MSRSFSICTFGVINEVQLGAPGQAHTKPLGRDSQESTSLHGLTSLPVEPFRRGVQDKTGGEGSQMAPRLQLGDITPQAANHGVAWGRQRGERATFPPPRQEPRR